jgi:hypothetical protein
MFVRVTIFLKKLKFQIRKTEVDSAANQLRTVSVCLLRGHAEQNQIYNEEK